MEQQKLNNAMVANEVAVSNEEDTQVETVETVNTINSLFADESKAALFSGANQLNKTAKLTQQATDIAHQIFRQMASNVTDYEGKIEASKKSHDAMDDLINEVVNLGEVDVDYLKTISDEEVEKMIRSQQSKRSRSKSKVMTQENYLTMMVGAVAENLLRLASDKPKSSGGGAVMGDIGYSDEDIQKFTDFPEDLKKEIRNIQSKKSIMKAKQDFDPQSTRWLQLLRAEQQLKELRDSLNGVATQEATEALKLKEQAEEMLADINTDELSVDDAKALLEKMKEMLASK